MNKTTSKNLRRHQLDRIFIEPIELSDTPCFRKGYIREIRESLGLNRTRLANLLGISPPALMKLEKNELEGSITLNSLKKIAEVLDCKLVYAIVPKTSLEDFLTASAKKIATKIVGRISHSMALESQSTSAKEKQRLIDELAHKLASNLDKQIWEEPE